jgi:hypothetical protein
MIPSAHFAAESPKYYRKTKDRKESQQEAKQRVKQQEIKRKQVYDKQQEELFERIQVCWIHLSAFKPRKRSNMW